MAIKNKTSQLHIRLTEEEKQKVRKTAEKLTRGNISDLFIRLLFKEEIKIRHVHIDKNLEEYLNIQQQIYFQYKAIGNNYNQVVKAINQNGTKEMHLSFQELVGYTKRLIEISRVLVKLSDRIYREKRDRDNKTRIND